MQITKAELKDLDGLAELFEAYRIFYQKKPAAEESKKFLHDRIVANESVIFMATNASGKMVGFTQLYPIFSSTRMRRKWLLNDLFVHESYRGQGISKALIERAKQLCKETDAAGLMLETAKTNVVGNSLYPATGFVLEDACHFYNWEND
jgi:GNAT superfamily N-acetyltransferase